MTAQTQPLTLLVLSGKGGVGKSTVAAHLALALAATGKKTGMLDTDIHGPSLPGMFGLEGSRPQVMAERLVPLPVVENLTCMSIGFLLEKQDQAVIWRGPRKYGAIKQLVEEVAWEDTEILVVDSPPGTGDEPLAVAQLCPKPCYAVVVTTPQDVALRDVRKGLSFCAEVDVPVLGIIENMSGFVCPHCGNETGFFESGGGRRLAEKSGNALLAEIPIQPAITAACEQNLTQTYYQAGYTGREQYARIAETVLEKINTGAYNATR
jgi:Mrp family chromosome partitioning ATPase